MPNVWPYLAIAAQAVAAWCYHQWRPIMAKPNGKRFKREELHAQANDKLGVEPGYELDCGKDQPPVWVPHPLFATDEQNQALQAMQDNPSVLDQAKLIVGENEYKRLVDAGYEAGDVMLCWMMMQKDMTDVTPTGSPTRSGS